MPKSADKQRGVVLYLVLATIMIVVILANIVLNVVLSQTRLTHHQVSRIQAYYAGLAGMNYALEQLRTGNWTAPAVHPLPADNSFPHTIRGVTIVLDPPGNAPPCNSTCTCVNVTVDYNFTQ
jgi:Tfp pilus assembly protein PilX